jgi:hypothetical protein
MKIRGASISYASHKAEENKLHEQELKSELTSLEKALHNDDNKQRYETILKDIEAINNGRTKGMQIRARCTHLEANERNTAYFFRLPLYNYSRISGQHH